MPRFYLVLSALERRIRSPSYPTLPAAALLLLVLSLRVPHQYLIGRCRNHQPSVSTRRGQPPDCELRPVVCSPRFLPHIAAAVPLQRRPPNLQLQPFWPLLRLIFTGFVSLLLFKTWFRLLIQSKSQFRCNPESEPYCCQSASPSSQCGCAAYHHDIRVAGGGWRNRIVVKNRPFLASIKIFKRIRSPLCTS